MFHKGKNETTQRAIHRLSFQAGIGKHSDSAVNKPCLFPSVLESDLHRSLAFEVLLKGNQLTPSLLPKHNQGEHQTCHILALISIELSLMFSQQREKKKKKTCEQTPDILLLMHQFEMGNQTWLDLQMELVLCFPI